LKSPELSALEQRADILERQVRSLRREVREWTELVDTIASPPWKRVWWFMRGYRLWKVGRWYGDETIPPQHIR
jgi:hypothetical protein